MLGDMGRQHKVSKNKVLNFKQLLLLLNRAEQSIAAGAVHTGKQEPPRERILDLVAKKREIFLVQMGLDTKRQEIWKLQQQTSQRAQALDKAEKLLDDDSKRFEDFLKQNAESLQEAMSHADTQSKAKNEKASHSKSQL